MNIFCEGFIRVCEGFGEGFVKAFKGDVKAVKAFRVDTLTYMSYYNILLFIIRLKELSILKQYNNTYRAFEKRSIYLKSLHSVHTRRKAFTKPSQSLHKAFTFWGF